MNWLWLETTKQHLNARPKWKSEEKRNACVGPGLRASNAALAAKVQRFEWNWLMLNPYRCTGFLKFGAVRMPVRLPLYMFTEFSSLRTSASSIAVTRRRLATYFSWNIQKRGRFASNLPHTPNECSAANVYVSAHFPRLRLILLYCALSSAILVDIETRFAIVRLTPCSPFGRVSMRLVRMLRKSIYTFMLRLKCGRFGRK